MILWFYNCLHSLGSATQQQQFLFITPSIQATSFSSPFSWQWQWQGLLLPSEHSRDGWKDRYPFSCLGTLSRLCLSSALACREVATHATSPHSVLALCNHCTVLLDAVVHVHREPEHLSTAQQWFLAQTSDSTNPTAQTSLSPPATGYELFAGNPE